MAAASTSGPSFEGQKFVFTGFRNKELEAYITARGGEISGSVSKKTTLVVCKDLDEDSSKIKKAKELGVPLAQVDDFIKSHKITLDS
jgi:NAD-dependent DNA ligase